MPILFLYAVLVLGEQAGQYGRGSLLVRLGQLGPLAVTAAQQITFGTGTKELLILKREQSYNIYIYCSQSACYPHCIRSIEGLL